jgi:hypothetical protein
MTIEYGVQMIGWKSKGYNDSNIIEPIEVIL